MKAKQAHRAMCAITLGIITVCMIAITIFAGFKHEVVKFKTMLVSIVIALLFQYLIGDPIKFVILAMDRALWPPKLYIPPLSDKSYKHDRRDFLKQRLLSQKSNLMISSQYRNWKLNEQYKVIAHDLFTYGQYYLCLMCLVLVTRDETLYHNTRIIKELFMNNHTDYTGLKEVYFLNQLYDFIESTLVIAFNTNFSGGTSTGWAHAEQTVLLGVIRLRQLRVVSPDIGLSRPEFSEMYYMPDWQLPYRRLYYADKYWRIYEPWIPIRVSFEFLDGLLMNFDHVGRLASYPELSGYVSLLARSTANSMKVLDYLHEYHWLTLNTSAVFIDFTLYNVDVNLFSICTLRLEKTPFGGTVPDVQVESAKLLEDVDQMPYTGLLALLIYVVVLIQFSQSLALKLWYEPHLLKSIWNRLDLFICLLNVMVVVLVVLREALVASMMKKVEGASKMEFIDFRRPSRLHQLTTITVGFLICVTTLRLWRVMQFSSIFELFTRTLYLAWAAVASTAIAIMIFLMGFCFAVVTINGNNSDNFTNFVKSMVMCMCFSFGFSAQVKPSELFYGGKWLGMFLYGVLAFVIIVLLINVFVSLINDYFTVAKTIRDHSEKDHRINFFQFLRVEFSRYFTCIHSLPCFRRAYVRNKRTVAQNVNRKLNVMDANRALQLSKQTGDNRVVKRPSDEDEEVQLKHKDRGERIINVGNILNTQFKLLSMILFEDYEEDNSDESETDPEAAGGSQKKIRKINLRTKMKHMPKNKTSNIKIFFFFSKS
ncbi:polycystic kidney disease 2-like 1 protein [Drosophila ficusphila]|uniref:polycystic kidney disease 2-like 1 protein n=1 Tax=Drosophila ficusphila TaxID=30025 RepID=UPI001C891F36|nr:polycystic kidney disease 2-like 1 protein [Drosophila ficusphila]